MCSADTAVHKTFNCVRQCKLLSFNQHCILPVLNIWDFQALSESLGTSLHVQRGRQSHRYPFRTFTL